MHAANSTMQSNRFGKLEKGTQEHVCPVAQLDTTFSHLSCLDSWIALVTALLVNEIPYAVVAAIVYWALWYWIALFPTGEQAGYSFLITILWVSRPDRFHLTHLLRTVSCSLCQHSLMVSCRSVTDRTIDTDSHL